MVVSDVQFKGRICRPHKAATSPLMDARTVLTESHWQFVDLWLKRKNMSDARFYWRQAREFYTAALGLSAQASPLPLYYCYLNIAKSLLTSKGVAYKQHHGVREKKMRTLTDRVDLSNEGVRLLDKGVAKSLSQYFSESESAMEHSLKDIFLNMPFIHRTYILTHERETEVYIPLINCRFVHDSARRIAYLRAELSRDYRMGVILRRAPTSFVEDPQFPGMCVRSLATVPCNHGGRPTEADIAQIQALNRQLRGDIEYINGSQTLWYLRTRPNAAKIISRRVPTLILMAMHRLSELCRYKPLELDKHLSSKKNWLIDEFLRMSPIQFVDEMASEITGYQFQAPNVRSPS